MRITFDPIDEGASARVEREGAGNLEGLPAGDVRLEFVVIDVGRKMHDGGRGRTALADDPTVLHTHEPVAAVQHAAAAALGSPPFGGDVGQVRLAVDHAIELEGRIPSHDETRERPIRVDRVDAGPLGHGPSLQSREQHDELLRVEQPAQFQLGRVDRGVLVDVRRNHDRFDPGRAQRRQARRRCGRQIQPGRGDGVRQLGSYARRMVANAREVELDATKIAHGGVVVSRHEGRVVFITDAIPGERVLARISDDARDRFWRAETIRVLEASPDRIPHLWPEADVSRDPDERPGGAEFGHITPERQRALKSDVLVEALERFAGLSRPVTVQAVPGEPDGSGWRSRLRLHVADDGTVGPYAARSHRVIPVDSLPLAVPALRAIAPRHRTVTGRSDSVTLVAPSADPARIAGRGGVIRERVGDREFVLDEAGFWQVHPAAASALTAAVHRVVDRDRLDPHAMNLDLYGGVGMLAAALGDLAGPGLAITSIESDHRATRHAQTNLAEWARATAETARVETWVRGLAERSARDRARLAGATVILDPPRSGAGAAVLEALVAVRPAQMIYVACDPVALARDAGTLGRLGYRLTALEALDLFPSTHHLEAVAAFQP